MKRELVYFSLSPKKGKNSPLRMKNPEFYPETGLDFEFIFQQSKKI